MLSFIKSIIRCAGDVTLLYYWREILKPFYGHKFSTEVIISVDKVCFSILKLRFLHLQFSAVVCINAGLVLLNVISWARFASSRLRIWRFQPQTKCALVRLCFILFQILEKSLFTCRKCWFELDVALYWANMLWIPRGKYASWKSSFTQKHISYSRTKIHSTWSAAIEFCSRIYSETFYLLWLTNLLLLYKLQYIIRFQTKKE